MFTSYLTCGVAWVSAAVVRLLVALAVAGVLEERLVFPSPVLTLLPSPGTQCSPLMFSSPRPRGSTSSPLPPPWHGGTPLRHLYPGLSAAGFPFELLVFTVLNFIYCS